MKKGLLIVYSGPSGVGKGSVRNELFKMEELNLAYSISMTTRLPRPGESDGVDYFFVSQERFDAAVSNDELLEYARFVSHSYGTPKAYVEKLRNEGKNVILEIETNGALQVMEKVPDCVSIFVTPPSLEELKSRLVHRQTETLEVIEKRIETAKKELLLQDKYKHVVVNDDRYECACRIRDILLEYINK